jgi:hypothetical protein
MTAIRWPTRVCMPSRHYPLDRWLLYISSSRPLPSDCRPACQPCAASGMVPDDPSLDHHIMLPINEPSLATPCLHAPSIIPIHSLHTAMEGVLLEYVCNQGNGTVTSVLEICAYTLHRNMNYIHYITHCIALVFTSSIQHIPRVTCTSSYAYQPLAACHGHAPA